MIDFTAFHIQQNISFCKNFSKGRGVFFSKIVGMWD